MNVYQRTIFRSQISPFTMWVPVFKLEPSDLASNACTQQTTRSLLSISLVKGVKILVYKNALKIKKNDNEINTNNAGQAIPTCEFIKWH